MTEPDRPIVLSYGGGIDTVALITLVLEGRLPRPETIVMADTARERQATWDYLDEVVQPALARVGLRVEIAPHDLSAVDLIADNGDLLIPVFTETGKLPTFCSSKWKQRVVRRWLRARGYGPERPIIEWLGFNLDEVQRLRKSDVAWIERQYPLCVMPETRMRRHEAILQIERHGWPLPPSSACWMCPNRNDETWLEMKRNEPEDFAKAAKLERVLRGAGWGDIYLHRSLQPIDEVDFEERIAQGQNGQLFDTCSYTCWT